MPGVVDVMLGEVGLVGNIEPRTRASERPPEYLPTLAYARGIYRPVAWDKNIVELYTEQQPDCTMATHILKRLLNHSFARNSKMKRCFRTALQEVAHAQEKEPKIVQAWLCRCDDYLADKIKAREAGIDWQEAVKQRLEKFVKGFARLMCLRSQ